MSWHAPYPGYGELHFGGCCCDEPRCGGVVCVRGVLRPAVPTRYLRLRSRPRQVASNSAAEAAGTRLAAAAAANALLHHRRVLLTACLSTCSQTGLYAACTAVWFGMMGERSRWPYLPDPSFSCCALQRPSLAASSAAHPSPLSVCWRLARDGLTLVGAGIFVHGRRSESSKCGGGGGPAAAAASAARGAKQRRTRKAD